MKTGFSSKLVMLCSAAVLVLGLSGCGAQSGAYSVYSDAREEAFPAAQMQEVSVEEGSVQAREAGTSEVPAPVLENASVSYLGPAGTYTEEAAQFFFPETAQLMPKETVPDAIADVMEGRADYAVIPQENTLGGAVVNYVDALIAAEDVYVAGEVILPISQTLMGVPGASLEDIQTVCSHAQGITQSAKWRAEHLPGAAPLYGLEVLAENVQITDTNKTRFYVLSASRLTGQNLPHGVFVASCEANMIDDIIVAIHEAGLEFVTLHDRPEGSALGIYNYIIEVENPDGIREAQLDELSAFPEIRYLGSFDVLAK
ncbi:MAG: hypothetical protein IIY28_09090 [Lachnospiraceae bacterium]|nr:hypothetical protein [Lachnospiraceae bacterium]